MVKGLDIFREHFASFNQSYALIGGVACMISFDEAGLSFRATKDLDIVLFVEINDSFKEFAIAFWKFIEQGKYECRQKSTSKKLFYRFHSPSNPVYPEIIELFSRSLPRIFHKKESHLTPLPITEEISSLSAILLNDDYYQFIHDGQQIIDQISLITPLHLIPLKARAYLDLLARRKAGDKIDEKDICKHRNDIIRLHQLLGSQSIILPKTINQDMKEFLFKIEDNSSINLKNLGLKNTSLDEILSILKNTYGLENMKVSN